ncbi:MAG: cupin-like domain-containing protein [Gammaproteobacteria bacterium]|nr:cupin-like domain-containing protein [Gammaproteobacteria bacterium]
MSNAMREILGLTPQAISDEILNATQPLLLRGLVADWPMVKAALASSHDAALYLLRFYRGAPVETRVAAPHTAGRYFYNDDLSGFNFSSEPHRLDDVLASLERHERDPEPPAIYVGSTAVDGCLPGLRTQNDLAMGDRNPLVSIWIGNRSRIAAHQDVTNNVACVTAGHRRFTLFPPEQLENLYVGPIDFNPAGLAISLVDFANPDHEKFPRFAEALRHAQVAELGPGDAIFIPGLWWHHVESLDGFNVLVNYWWRKSPDYLGSPITALMHGILSLRDLPPEQRDAWHGIFRHYVFEHGDQTVAHIPPEARSVLSPLDESAANALRAQIIKRLGR